jgi:hypothetical protein
LLRYGFATLWFCYAMVLLRYGFAMLWFWIAQGLSVA